MKPARVYLHAIGVVSALGEGIAQTRERLFAGDSASMIVEPGWLPDGDACVGKVEVALDPLPPAFAAWDCRNNRLLLRAAAQIRPAIDAAIAEFGPHRIGVVLGTSTSGIAAGEPAMAHKLATGTFPQDFDYRMQEIGATGPIAARLLGVSGPAYTVSTACTSGAKALIAARNLLRLGICDAVIAGGVDTLCRLTVCGFTALESTSPTRSNPMSRNRRGINIGEAAALFLLRREEAAVALSGAGESSDAYHLSAPDPNGAGAERAIHTALEDADVNATNVNYVNLHATATLKNDEMESRVMARMFPHGVACSGTKPLTGHTLGAAGALEAAFCWLTLTGNGELPPHVWDGEFDPALPALNLVASGARLGERPRVCMSNSYAFGGSNVSLVFSV